jgi:hypothetical protein
MGRYSEPEPPHFPNLPQSPISEGGGRFFEYSPKIREYFSDIREYFSEIDNLSDFSPFP